MTNKSLRIILSVIFIITSMILHAQNSIPSGTLPQDSAIKTTDSLLVKEKFFKRIATYFEEAQKDKTQSKFDISFIGGPSYSVETKLGLGMMASGLYRIDKQDMSLPPSDVAIYANITTSGFFSVGVQNTTIFP